MSNQKMTNNVVHYQRPAWAVCPDYGSIFYRPIRNTVVHGGRSSGKTTTAVRDITLLLTQKPLRLICGRQFMSAINKSIKQVFVEAIKELQLNSFFKIMDTEIKAINGSQIDFMGFDRNEGNIKGLQSYDICLIDEAQDISRSVLDTLKPTIRKDGSRLIFLMNRRHTTDAVDVDYIQHANNNTQVHHVNYYKNPFFSKEAEIERLHCLKTQAGRYGHIWLGEHDYNANTRVFNNWTIKEFETDKQAMFRLGADWGYAIDPTCAVRCYINCKTLYIDYEAYKIGCEIVDIPDLFMAIPEANRWIMYADSARPETISHLNNNGFPKLMKASKGKGSVEEGIAWLQSYDIIVHPRCKHVIEELATYSYKVNRQTNEVLPILEDKNNHLIDSLRYATEALRKIFKNDNYDDYEYDDWRGAVNVGY